MISLKRAKSLSCITREWDAIAELREQQVSSGKDHSANFVLAPAILNELAKAHSLVDIGCGTGWLTARAAKCADTSVGLDPSRESIAIAESQHHDRGIRYYAESVEQYSRRRTRFDVAISNMAASSAPDLEAFFSSSRLILKKNAIFIFTIPHPCFWPLYWGYASKPRFHYEKSFAVEGEFKIRNQATNLITTHFHHPLARYASSLSSAKLSIEELRELSGRGFKLPRFMLIKARAI